MTRRVLTLAAGVLVAACGSDEFVGELRRPPESPTTTVAVDTTGTGDLESSTGDAGVGDACAADMPCPGALFCVAQERRMWP